MFDTKTFTAKLDLKEGAEEGHVRAAFSIFNTKDTTGDVVLPSFFEDGQAIPMAAWGHSWELLPPGKGVIRVREDYAEFDGHFFLDTTQGLDHYRTVKRLGDLQEWSFGFRILDAEEGMQDGEPVRFLKRGETFEASPVLVGAHRDTHTLAIKSAEVKRHLRREHMDRIIAVILEALNADEAIEDEDVPADSGKAASPLAVVDAYVAGLSDADDAALLDERQRIAALLDETRSASATLDALLKRVDDIGREDPRELFRQFRRLEGLYGPIHGGRRAG